MVPYDTRIDVFVSLPVPLHGRHMYTALVGEGTPAHIRLVGIWDHIGDLGDVTGYLPDPCQLIFGDTHLKIHFQSDSRNYRAQVCVTAPLTPPVYGSLDMLSSQLQKYKGVCHRTFRVVVHVSPY